MVNSLIRRCAERALDGTVHLFALNTPGRVRSRLVEKIAPVHVRNHGGVEYRFSCPNRLTHWRAETFLTKEPDTLAWIDGFRPGDVLFDVGANVGLYSIYAASRGVSVLAFEPEARNLAELNRNIHLNGVDSRVVAIPVALSDHYGPDFLYGSDFAAGSALNTVGEPVDWRHRPYTAASRQGVFCFPLDRFLAECPASFPNHLKIDVDGGESRVLSGAAATLSDFRLRSVLIELNEEMDVDIRLIEVIEAAGLAFVSKAASPLVPEGGLHSRSLNYLFAR